MASVLKQSFRQKDERNKIPEKWKNDGRKGRHTKKQKSKASMREKTTENKRLTIKSQALK